MPRISVLVVSILLLAISHGAAGEDQVMEREHAVEPPRARAAEALACTQCHRCETPTTEDPCLVACPRHGGRFYGQHRVDEGPDIVIIDQLAALYRPVVFAHRTHATMANLSGGCENCHHYSEESGTIPPCRSCHDPSRQNVDLHMPALKGAYHRQCINCHLDWAGENACGFCHEPAGEGPVAAASVTPDITDIVGIPHPRIVATPTYIYETSHADGPVVSFHHTDHTEAFGLQCVDCHRGDSCKSCHDAGAPVARQIDHVVTCGACHAERDCGFCHGAEPKPRFDHATSVGWHLDPYHVDVDCDTCHGRPQSFRTPTGRCSDCHIHWKLGSFDHDVVGLVLDEAHAEADCEDCHWERAFHEPPTCDACHPEEMYPDFLPGERVPRK